LSHAVILSSLLAISGFVEITAYASYMGVVVVPSPKKPLTPGETLTGEEAG